MDMKKRARKILEVLNKYYPQNGRCFLDYNNPWQLLFATILSAQCTDRKVNEVTAILFEKYRSLDDFATADPSGLELDIKSTGFYRNKAKNIILSARMLLGRYGGQVPSEMELLLKLPGVGRKTANLVLGQIFNIPGIVVDTHVKRVSYLLGLTANTDPEKIEYDLMKILPKADWIRFNPQIIEHGRKICIANRPQCGMCCLAEYCDYIKHQSGHVPNQ